jgi:HrpA-like RNA helicase
VSENNITIINIATGSGKSIGIPSIIAQTGTRIFVSVPTVNAALSLASFQRQATEGISIGTAVEGDIKYNNDTLIVYATAGHIRRKMLSSFRDGKAQDIDFCDVLMVDEVHSGTVDNYVILSLWKEAFRQGVVVPRLILSSATLSLLTKQMFPDAKMFEVEFESLPVDIRYYGKQFNLDDQKIYSETAAVVMNLIRNSSVEDIGNILVFAPGSSEVNDIITNLQKLLDASEKNIRKNDILIIPAYGSLSQEEIQQIYKPLNKGQIKVIVATNIAESAITIDDLGAVVDTMTEKRLETSSSNGLRLSLHYESKASAKQRSGRTGRMRSGIVYRMTTEDFYESLEENRPEEITQIPIYSVIMEIRNVGLNPLQLFPDINPELIDSTNTLLLRLEMLEKDEDNYRITEKGQFVAELPLSVRNGSIVWDWKETTDKPLFPAVCATCLVDSFGPSYFYFPKRMINEPENDYVKRLETIKIKYFNKFKGETEIETFLNMFIDLLKQLGGLKNDKQAIAKWSSENSCNNKKIKELVSNVIRTSQTLRKIGYTVQEGLFNAQNVAAVFRPILDAVYGDSVLKLNGDPRKLMYVDRRGKEYKLDLRHSVSSFSIDNAPNRLISIISVEIGTKTGRYIRMINLFDPVPKKEKKEEEKREEEKIEEQREEEKIEKRKEEKTEKRREEKERKKEETKEEKGKKAEKMTVTQLKDALKAQNIAFSSKLLKAGLIELYLKSQETDKPEEQIDVSPQKIEEEREKKEEEIENKEESKDKVISTKDKAQRALALLKSMKK